MKYLCNNHQSIVTIPVISCLSLFCPKIEIVVLLTADNTFFILSSKNLLIYQDNDVELMVYVILISCLLDNVETL